MAGHRVCSNVSETNFEEIDLNSMKGEEFVDPVQKTSSEEELTPKVLIEKDSKKAWLICFAGFLIQVCNVGFLQVYGIFFVVFLKEFKSSKATTAWVGSITYGLAMAFGPVSGWLIHRFGKRRVAILGSFTCAVALALSSFVTTLEMLFVTLSLLYGVGCSLCFTPIMVLGSEYFSKYTSLATGMMTAGSSIGTLVLAPVSQALVDVIGWRNTFRFFGGFSLLTIWSGYMLTPAVEARKPTSGRTLPNELEQPFWSRLKTYFSIWKNPIFIAWATATTFVMFGYFTPYVHLIAHAINIGISVEQGSSLLMCLGATTAVGRVMFGKIGDLPCINRLYMHQLSIAITGTSLLLLPLMKSFSGLLVLVFVIGLVDGIYVVCLPVLTASLMGLEKSVQAWSFLVGTASITYTLGPPCAGMVYDSFQSYDLAFYIAGVAVLLGSLILFSIPWLQKKYGSQIPATVYISFPPDRQTTEEPRDLFTNMEYLGLDVFPQPASTISLQQEEPLPLGTSPARDSFVIIDLDSDNSKLHWENARIVNRTSVTYIAQQDPDDLPTGVAEAFEILKNSYSDINQESLTISRKTSGLCSMKSAEPQSYASSVASENDVSQNNQEGTIPDSSPLTTSPRSMSFRRKSRSPSPFKQEMYIIRRSKSPLNTQAPRKQQSISCQQEADMQGNDRLPKDKENLTPLHSRINDYCKSETALDESIEELGSLRPQPRSRSPSMYLKLPSDT